VTAGAWGAILVQIDNTGAITTKVVASPQAFASAGEARESLPAPDANNIRLGVPMVVPGARHARFALHYAILSNAGGLRCRPNRAG